MTQSDPDQTPDIDPTTTPEVTPQPEPPQPQPVDPVPPQPRELRSRSPPSSPSCRPNRATIPIPENKKKRPVFPLAAFVSACAWRYSMPSLFFISSLSACGLALPPEAFIA